MASRRQFQSAIVLGKYENLLKKSKAFKISLELKYLNVSGTLLSF